MQTPTSAQQQQIDQLTEAVNTLSGKLAATMAYVAAVTTPVKDQTLKGRIQGAAQGLAPTGMLSRTAPGLHASQGVDQIVALSQQLQNPLQP
jgi:hypothetical protein